MALSQSLEDSPLRLRPRQVGSHGLNVQEVYNERHRLALEQLLSGGVDDFLGFLRKERIHNFLSDEEIQRIRSSVVPTRCVSVHGEDLEPSLGGSLDCSSVTYFPEASDVEPPLLELGWPAFTAGSYRGVTRAVAHFQPSCGDSIYSCKEAARRLIRSATEVIAIVTDALTDLDVFKDLQEACSQRKVPVYVLLDQACAPAFLKMCRNVGVRLDDLQQMRVRTITGTTYYTRSGARITGKVHERFMLIDGNRVATGSYRFNWTDGKLNSSNLIELSGQISERFDEEFRVLYAQSQPVSTRGPPGGPPGVRGSSVFESLVVKHPVTFSPRLTREKLAEPACLTSTPSRKPQALVFESPREPTSPDPREAAVPVSDSTTIDGMEQKHVQEEILAGSVNQLVSRHASTQTSTSVADSDTQTDAQQLAVTTPPSARPVQSVSLPPSRQTSAPAAAPSLKDTFHKLTRERQHHYSAIRSKLERVMTSLGERRELADVTNVTRGLGAHSRQRVHRDGAPPGEGAAMGTWPRSRCAH